jgi:peptide/nickel transport system substrate-binding protein
MNKIKHVVAMTILVIVSFSVNAKTLKIGARATPSIDPHFGFLTTNIAYNAHIYGFIVGKNENSRKIPDLAISWKSLNATTWEFKLRKGVKFSDGSDFTAEDVKWSIERIPNVPNNPNPYTGTIRSIKEIIIKNQHTIQFITHKLNPYLPDDFGEVLISSKKAGNNASTADFQSGKAAIGTGPYKVEKHVQGEKLILKRNNYYYGKKPAWDKVEYIIISDDAARVAALLSGDVDMIDGVPPLSVSLLEKNSSINVFKRASDRIIYFFANQRGPTKYITDNNGQPLKVNPLKDIRVRRAISKGIDRQAILSRVMDGLAELSGQTVPKGWFGYNPKIPVEKYNPDEAKRLLSEAGYPNGFGLTIHGPNNRYVNDSKIVQAVGQMLSRIGLTIKVDTMPRAAYFPKINVKNGVEFSLGLLGWGNTPYPASGHLGLMHCTKGNYNRSGYCNSKYDQMIDDAVSTVDDSERELKEMKAVKLAMDELAVIPLHVQYTILAGRKGINYSPRADERTEAMNASPE